MTWTILAVLTATAVICTSNLKTRSLLMSAAAENARQLAQVRDQLVGLAPTFQRGLAEVTDRIETLQNENVALDFGPVREAIAPLQAAAEALDNLVPEPVEQEPVDAGDESDETPAPADGADTDTPPLPPVDDSPAVENPGDVDGSTDDAADDSADTADDAESETPTA